MQFSCSQNLEDNKEVILASIAHAYETGLLEDPNYGSMLGGVFALLCEGKVEGEVGEDMIQGPVWKLTPEYERELTERKAALSSANVFVGPWGQDGL